MKVTSEAVANSAEAVGRVPRRAEVSSSDRGHNECQERKPAPKMGKKHARARAVFFEGWSELGTQ